MSFISSVNSAAAAFYQNTAANTAGPARAVPADPAPGAGASQASTIVTLGNKQTSNVIPMSVGSLSAMPLTEAWAPQMLVQADTNNDMQLNADEFAAQMKRVDMAVDDAKKMFEVFDTSGDGRVSVEEYVAGVKTSNASGSTLFNSLLDTYTHGPDGKPSDQAMTDFLGKGLAVANQYWAGRR